MQHREKMSLQQGLANDSAKPGSHLWRVFTNSLAHSHTHSFVDCGWLFS